MHSIQHPQIDSSHYNIRWFLLSRAEEISRGDILCSPDTFSSSQVNIVSAQTTASTIPITNFAKNPYYKGDLAENQTYMISVGLQIKPVRLKLFNGTVNEIKPESKPVAFFPSQTYVLLKPDSQGTRIIGRGIIE